MVPFFVEKLAVWSSSPKDRPEKAKVLLIHGLSEHSGRHLNTETALLKAGFGVVRFDLRGAGQSGGRRQWVEKFSDYVEDVSLIYRWICRELPPSPLFLMGHSLGGAIAVNFLESYQKAFRGCILSAPAHQVGGAISPLTLAIGKQLVKVFPTLRIPGNSDKSAISKDPEVVKAFLEDPLCHHSNTLSQGRAILDELPLVSQRARTLQLPVLILHGSLDRIIKLEGSFEILKSLGSRDRSLHIISGGYHEPHNDVEKKDYFEAMVNWLNQQLKSF